MIKILYFIKHNKNSPVDLKIQHANSLFLRQNQCRPTCTPMNFYDNNLRGKRYLQLVLITLTS